MSDFDPRVLPPEINGRANQRALEDLFEGRWPITPTGSSVARPLGDILGSVQHPGLYNFKPSNLKKWRLARARVRSGAGLAKVAFVGDSTWAGQGSGTANAGKTGARAKAVPAVLAGMFDLPAHANSIWGSGGTGFAALGYDGRLTLGAGWTEGSAGISPMFLNNSTTSSLSFSPSTSVDTFDIWYVQNSGFATFTVNVDGGAALATVNASGAGSLQKATVSAALGTHTLNIQRNGTGTTCYIVGIDAYDSTSKKVHLWNMGWAGTRVTHWKDTTNPWSAANVLATTAPDLTIINLGINDWDAVTPAVQFKADYQVIIDKSRLSGDVILVVPFPSETSAATLAEQATISTAIYELAAVNDLPVIDLTQRFIDYNNASTLGLYYDALHPNALGYADAAQLIAKALMI